MSGCAIGIAQRKLIDAGGYELDLTTFGGWTIRTDKAQNYVMLERTESTAVDTVRGDHFCVLRVTLPESLRQKPHAAIARDFCAAPDSFVQKKLFPAPISQRWAQVEDTTVGDRVAVTFRGGDNLTSRPGARIPAGSVQVYQRAIVHVWFPATFERNGAFYLVSGFETVTIPPALTSGLPIAEDLLAAINPR